jgi:hypothetical protein
MGACLYCLLWLCTFLSLYAHEISRDHGLGVYLPLYPQWTLSGMLLSSATPEAVCVCVCVLGFELRTYTLSHATSPFV